MAELVDRPARHAGRLICRPRARGPARRGQLRKSGVPIRAGDQNELNIVQSAALTLLGLIVGFSFSMAVTRYDQRKNLEEAEANAIGTEYTRADLDARERGCGGARIAEAISGSAHPLLFDRRPEQARANRRGDGKAWRRSLGLGAVPRRGPADARNGAYRFGHERRAQFRGLHDSRLVESHPDPGMVADGR